MFVKLGLLRNKMSHDYVHAQSALCRLCVIYICQVHVDQYYGGNSACTPTLECVVVTQVWIVADCVLKSWNGAKMCHVWLARYRNHDMRTIHHYIVTWCASLSRQVGNYSVSWSTECQSAKLTTLPLGRLACWAYQQSSRDETCPYMEI